MSDEEVDKCGTGARWQAKLKILKEEVLYAQDHLDRSRLEWLESNGLLGDWISNMEEIVTAAKNACRALSESGNFKNEHNLDNLKNVLISLTADLKVIQSWRVCLKDKGLLDNWISNMEEIVKAVEDVSFKLLKSGGNFKNKPNFNKLRHVLISLTAELQVFKSWKLGARACAR
jgi:hypothetical protein